MPRKHPRERVERGLYRHGDVYEACATPPGSKQAVWTTLGHVGLMEARRLRDQWAVRVRAGDVAHLDRAATVAAVADAMLVELEALQARGEISDATVRAYRHRVRTRIAGDPIGRKPVQRVTHDDLLAWQRRRQTEGLAQWTLASYWATLRTVLGHAARHRLIPANPADTLKRRERPLAGKARTRFLDAEEIRALLGHASLGTMLALFCGLRASEACGLTWEDVRDDHIRCHYQLLGGGQRGRLKSDRARRDIILMGALARELKRHRLASPWSRPTDPVLAASAGGHVSYNTLRTRFAGERGLAGLGPDVTLHVLRHTFASVLIDQGRDVEFVSRQLGHANTAVTWGVYVHLFRARENADAARSGLDAAYGGLLRVRSERP